MQTKPRRQLHPTGACCKPPLLASQFGSTAFAVYMFTSAKLWHHPRHLACCICVYGAVLRTRVCLLHCSVTCQGSLPVHATCAVCARACAAVGATAVDLVITVHWHALSEGGQEHKFQLADRHIPEYGCKRVAVCVEHTQNSLTGMTNNPQALAPCDHQQLQPASKQQAAFRPRRTAADQLIMSCLSHTLQELCGHRTGLSCTVHTFVSAHTTSTANWLVVSDALPD
jgi:hypothetical protein